MIQHSNGERRHVIDRKFTHSPDHIQPRAGKGFVVTAQVAELIERATAYLEAGYPINLSGPAGTGKTTLALHVAATSGRPVMLIHGDDEFGSSDLVGNDMGYRKNRLVDQYVHSVLKEEETMRTLWIDNRLTTACRYGHTLVYDEFTRSRPEANNVLLSVLGEEILNLPKLRYSGEGYLKVHPDFRAIFTSNPEEYAGIHKSQDALMDRLITIHVDYFDRETEAAIAAATANIRREGIGRACGRRL
jgi:gas vesicle protein GvpN